MSEQAHDEEDEEETPQLIRHEPRDYSSVKAVALIIFVALVASAIAIKLLKM
jgi:hypothetical protein